MLSLSFCINEVVDELDESSPQHAQLEVAILGSESAPPEADVDDRRRKAPGGRTVLILGTDSELRAYIRKCLQALEEVYITEGVIWSEVRERHIDTLPQLFVIEASNIAMAGTLGGFDELGLEGVSRLLILDDRVSDDNPGVPSPCIMISKPFNAERLVNAASMLLG